MFNHHVQNRIQNIEVTCNNITFKRIQWSKVNQLTDRLWWQIMDVSDNYGHQHANYVTNIRMCHQNVLIKKDCQNSSLFFKAVPKIIVPNKLFPKNLRKNSLYHWCGFMESAGRQSAFAKQSGRKCWLKEFFGEVLWASVMNLGSSSVYESVLDRLWWTNVF